LAFLETEGQESVPQDTRQKYFQPRRSVFSPKKKKIQILASPHTLIAPTINRKKYQSPPILVVISLKKGEEEEETSRGGGYWKR